jgi:hypothetical protein
MLDVDLRNLSFGRDGHASARPASPSFADITVLINDLNAGGVGYAKRLSSEVLTDLLEVTGRWVSDHVLSLPQHDRAYISVLWAGEEVSENWMDTGREYTERWHHQMQIRDAVGVKGLLEARWMFPLLDLSVRSFPRAYEQHPGDIGTAIAFEVTGDEAWTWTLLRERSGWKVHRGGDGRSGATIRTDADSAWKLLYNALSNDAAKQRIAIDGDRMLAAPLLAARSVMV